MDIKTETELEIKNSMQVRQSIIKTKTKTTWIDHVTVEREIDSSRPEVTNTSEVIMWFSGAE